MGNVSDKISRGNQNTHFVKHIQIFTSIHNKYCLTQLYFARGDMFRLLIQPSSGHLTIEQDLLCAHNMGFQTVYIQGVSRLKSITAGGDFLGLCDEKSSY